VLRVGELDGGGQLVVAVVDDDQVDPAWVVLADDAVHRLLEHVRAVPPGGDHDVDARLVHRTPR
jgi:hypothetical protein